MKNAIDEQVMENKMLWLGFRENIAGTQMLRIAIKLWEPGMSITKELYPAIAKKVGSTPSRVERAMRHAIETAWDRGDGGTILNTFGYTVSSQKGAPTVGEFVARMARVCALED